MSLIQEALEKAGRTAEEGRSVAATPPPAADSRPPTGLAANPKRNSQTLILVAGVIVFLTGLIAYHLLSTWVEHSSLKKDEGKALLPFVEARVPSLVPDLSPLPKFVLTGITASGKERLALINNQVVRVGDPIGENAFVKEIQERRVILEFRGREVKLTL